MKKYITFLKIGFITFSLTVIFGIVPIPTQQRVSGQTPACSDTPCQPGVIYGCYHCTASNCNGCYVANGDSGCGVCSKGPNENQIEVDTSWFNFKRYRK